MKAVVEATVGGVVALREEVFVEGGVVGGVEIEGEFVRPLGEAGNLDFEHVVVEGDGDESG